jgi:excinuclease UvrABC ATPase subunit
MKIAGINMTYEGLIPRVQKSILSKDKEAMQPHVRAFLDRAVTFRACPECGGTRLSEAARSSKIKGINIADACAMQISDPAEWVRGIDEPSVAPLLASVQRTLDSFVEIGLGYLGLDRSSGTLSGGEAQRVKMIRQLGSSLTDVTYVFDEPTIGLHPHAHRHAGDPRRRHPQPAGRRRGHPARRPGRRHRGGRLGQELADRRLSVRP